MKETIEKYQENVGRVQVQYVILQENMNFKVKSEENRNNKSKERLSIRWTEANQNE